MRKAKNIRIPNSAEIEYQPTIHDAALEETLKNGKGLVDFRKRFGITQATYYKWKSDQPSFRRIHHKYLGMLAMPTSSYFDDAVEYHAVEAYETEVNQYTAAIHDKAIEEMLSKGLLPPHFCKEFKIAARTLWRWCTTHTSFHQAYARGLMGGQAVWIDEMKNNRSMQFVFWNAIMKHYFKFGYEPMHGYTSGMSSTELLSFALDCLGGGRIQGRMFDQLVHAAEVKLKVEETAQHAERLKAIEAQLGLKLEIK